MTLKGPKTMPSADQFDLTPSAPAFPSGTAIPPLKPSTPPAFVVTPLPPPPVRLAAPASVLFASLLIGGMGCALFYNQGIGINVLMLVVLLLAAAASLADREGVESKWKNLALVLPPLIFFALMTSFRASGLLTFWNVFACHVLADFGRPTFGRRVSRPRPDFGDLWAARSAR